VAPLLRRAGDWGRLIVPDLPGWGRSARPEPNGSRCTVESLIPNSAFIPVPEAGHWPFYDEPRLIDEIIDLFAAG
jgi:pimeloyl-ACP methyl ester carboxylesterase